MRRVKSFLTTLSAIACLALAGYGVYWIGMLFWKGFCSLEKDVAKAMVAASGTVLVAVVVTLTAKYFERRREIELQQRTQKIEIYDGFMQKLFDVFMADKTGKTMSEEELTAFLIEFTRKLIVWGSSGLIQHYSKWRKHIVNVGTGTEVDMQGILLLEQVLYEIRKDLGNSNRGLNPGDLLSLFINDIPSVIARR